MQIPDSGRFDIAIRGEILSLGSTIQVEKILQNGCCTNSLNEIRIYWTPSSVSTPLLVPDNGHKNDVLSYANRPQDTIMALAIAAVRGHTEQYQ